MTLEEWGPEEWRPVVGHEGLYIDAVLAKYDGRDPNPFTEPSDG
jgi:hypothetical protein